MAQQAASRRAFLRSAGRFGAAVLASGAVDGDWLFAQAQASAADALRARMGVLPIQKTPLGRGITMLAGPGGNVVVLQSPAGKILVDGFLKPAWPKLKAELDALDGSPIKSLIDTHWHLDHADNNGNARADGAGVIAHDNTRKRLLEPHDLAGMHFDPVPSADIPTQTFASGLTLNATVEQIRLQHIAPAHTDTDIFVHFPKANVLHMGDVFFNGFYPFIDVSTGGHINGMIDGVTSALQIANATTKVVPGHGPAGDLEALRAYGRMLAGIRDKVRTLKASGKSLADVKAAKPSADYDARWGTGGVPADAFVEVVYTTVR